jgi:hypothetical protein
MTGGRSSGGSGEDARGAAGAALRASAAGGLHRAAVAARDCAAGCEAAVECCRVLPLQMQMNECRLPSKFRASASEKLSYSELAEGITEAAV